MREIEKLLRKISAKERADLLRFLERLLVKTEHPALDVKKLKGSDLYRARKGNFRIIFHYDSNSCIVVDSIRLRDENTYRDV
jgi:mRNA-degrading endonuclease RelE of RelBE toxin-antitoxin system